MFKCKWDNYYTRIAIDVLPYHNEWSKDYHVQRNYQWWKAICLMCKFPSRTKRRLTTRNN